MLQCLSSLEISSSSESEVVVEAKCFNIGECPELEERFIVVTMKTDCPLMCKKRNRGLIEKNIVLKKCARIDSSSINVTSSTWTIYSSVQNQLLMLVSFVRRRRKQAGTEVKFWRDVARTIQCLSIISGNKCNAEIRCEIQKDAAFVSRRLLCVAE